MAKPNYSFEKRQRELQKKQKKELKERERADRKSGPPGSETGEADGTAAAGPAELADAPAMGPGPT